MKLNHIIATYYVLHLHCPLVFEQEYLRVLLNVMRTAGTSHK